MGPAAPLSCPSPSTLVTQPSHTSPLARLTSPAPWQACFCLRTSALPAPRPHTSSLTSFRSLLEGPLLTPLISNSSPFLSARSITQHRSLVYCRLFLLGWWPQEGGVGLPLPSRNLAGGRGRRREGEKYGRNAAGPRPLSPWGCHAGRTRAPTEGSASIADLPKSSALNRYHLLLLRADSEQPYRQEVWEVHFPP